ncbi:MAG: tRNA 2-thiouridine(34) synthase MnmA [Spirochaetota bacterium]|nr:tRNA 2-thiouridine(34) synthase MnmA [Spirochaetota bacterium]
MKIAVGLSGGIDSTAALIRLSEEGHDLIGITMRATFHDQEYGKCCSIEDVHDAKLICQNIGIRHYVIDVKDEFNEKIIQYFISEYLRGRTPNPCLFCNELIKFKRLIEAANTLGYNYFATGHYAIVEKRNDEIILKKGLDPLKDQSYFLSRLPLSILDSCVFPLGNTIKQDNIDFLKMRAISISQKRESHEICFVPGDDYTKFIHDEVGNKIIPGNIIDEAGKILGKHDGIPYYTIGQRRGLNIAAGKPIYARELNPETNTITVGEKPYTNSFIMKQVNWLTNYDFDNPIYISVKVRYFHDGEDAILTKHGSDEFFVQFKNPVFSVTKGQAAVGYLNDRVIFSGIIN